MIDKQLRILVVEDQRSTSDFLVEFLASLSHWVEACPDVTKALARMEQGGFDLLLTDVHLPDGTAWSLLGELELQGQRPSRVVSMSAFDPGKARQRSRALMCYGHLISPFAKRELLALLT